MQKKISVQVLALVVIFLHSIEVFGDRQGTELGFGLNRFLFGDNIGLEDEYGFRLNLGYRFDGPFAIELSYNETSAEIQLINEELDVTHWYGDLVYHFNSGGSVEPYLALGYGVADADLIDGESYDVGLGIKFYASDNFIIRPDIHYADVDEFNDDHMIASLNLSWLIGGSSKKQAPVKTEPPQPADSDRDGVADNLDQCPGTPSGVSVDGKGCPLDSDGDGVYDHQDNCPDTESKLKVDMQGCPLVLKDKVSIDLEVNFDSNSDVVKPEYISEIGQVADFLSQYANTVVVIEGHTDTSGAADYNKSLSQRRADSVANVLVDQFGVARQRVTAIGYGEERPIADESTREGRMANRRVVAEISTEVEKLQQK